MSRKSLLIGAVVAVFAVASFNALAEEKAVPSEASAKKAAAHELTCTGKVMVKEAAKGEAAGAEKKYVLVSECGEIDLPAPKAKAGEKAIDLAAFVGKEVKVTAKGMCKAQGDKKCAVKSIVSIEEAAAAPAPAAK